jgi:hypothetical protein
MGKLIKFNNNYLSKSMTIANKIHFYCGSTDRWGFSLTYSIHDHALTVELVHWYLAIEVWSYEE